MAWLGPKKYKFEIKDKEIEKQVREHSLKYFEDLFFKLGRERWNSYMNALIQHGKLNPSFKKDFLLLIKQLQDGLLFRGIDAGEYKEFLKHGNTKTRDNISMEELAKLQLLKARPEEVMYAAHNMDRAWECVQNKNPSTLVVYNKDCFTKFDENYLFRIKKGLDFKDAVKAYIIVVYK